MIKDERKQLSIYSICHLCIDALCAYLLYALMPNPLVWLIGYHGLAFCAQPIVGIVTDRYPHVPWGKLSIVLVLSGYLLYRIPVPAVMFAGLGNAFFHLEGGYVALHQEKGTMKDGGTFVSFGALGIGLATYLGRFFPIYRWLFMGVVGIPCLVLLWLADVQVDLRTRVKRFGVGEQGDRVWVCLFIAMIIRSLAGYLLPMPEWSAGSRIIVVAVMSFLGKYLGGFLAEKYGYRMVAVISQVICVGAAMCSLLPFSALMVFAINVPMAITLAAVSDCFPERTGFAFGLAPLALFIGYILSLLLNLSETWSGLLCAFLMCISAVLLSLAIQNEKLESK